MRSGVVLLMISMAITPLGDGLSKSLGENYSPFFICFLRYFLAGMMALVLAVIFRVPIFVPRKDRIGIIWRTALVMGAMTSLIGALMMVPLATAVGGFLIAPIVACFLAIVLLGERMTLPKAIGAVLSILGAVIIARPEGTYEIGTGLSLLGGALLGGYLVATRAASKQTNAISTLAVQCLLGSMMLAPFAFIAGSIPFSENLVYAGAGLGVVTACCHFLTVTAFAREEASVLAPFLYFNMIAAVLISFLLFDEKPEAAALFGLALIAMGGWTALISDRKWTVLARLNVGPGDSSMSYQIKSALFRKKVN